MDAAEIPKVNINTASYEELQQVKGIGPKSAQAIVEFRKQNQGPITSVQLTSIGSIRASRDILDQFDFEPETDTAFHFADVVSHTDFVDDEQADILRMTEVIDNAQSQRQGPPRRKETPNQTDRGSRPKTTNSADRDREPSNPDLTNDLQRSVNLLAQIVAGMGTSQPGAGYVQTPMGVTQGGMGYPVTQTGMGYTQAGMGDSQARGMGYSPMLRPVHHLYPTGRGYLPPNAPVPAFPFLHHKCHRKCMQVPSNRFANRNANLLEDATLLKKIFQEEKKVARGTYAKKGCCRSWWAS